MTEPQTATESRALAIRKQADSVRAVLSSPAMQAQLKAALPRHLTPERLVRVAVTAIQQTPKLLECDRTSLFAAIMTCAQLGLEPDGVLGQAYLVPFGTRVQFIPGYRGLISLARNSGEVLSIFAKEVCAQDLFQYAYGLDEVLKHIPADGDRGEIIGFYAIARFKDGGHHWDYMTRAEVERIRDSSQGWQAFAAKKTRESPWASHFAEMGKKTVIRRISKYLPMNVQRAAALADAYDSGRHGSLDAAGEVVIQQDQEGGMGPQPAQLTGLDAFAVAGQDSTQDALGSTEAPVAEVRTPGAVIGPLAEPDTEDGPPWVVISAEKLGELERHLAASPIDEPALAVAMDLEGVSLRDWPATSFDPAVRHLASLRQDKKRKT